MLEENITIVNKLGLHARAAAKLVKHASQYQASIEFIKQDATINAKSIMGVMMLAASRGTTLQLRIDGTDEQAALDDIKQLIADRFGEEE
jgi:phosphocarrier protein HPr